MSALLKFVPAQLPESPQFRGLHVDLVVRSVNIWTLMPMGAPLTHVALGSTVHVLVQVTTLDSVSETTVRALMPGGLEPIDGNLDGDGTSPTAAVPVYYDWKGTTRQSSLHRQWITGEICATCFIVSFWELIV